MTSKSIEEKERVVVRFAGDSGDGIQLAGNRFAAETALIGNDLVTLPDFPAEIRAPAGTLAGVSAFQIHFASRDILTPGGRPNVLVAMNPAALKANLAELEPGGIVIANEDGFTKGNLRKADYDENPLEDGSLDDYQVFRVPMTSMTVRATEGIDGISSRDAARSKNFFALGLVSWMYSRPDRLRRCAGSRRSSSRSRRSVDANLAAFRAGYNFGETAELLQVSYEVEGRARRAGHLPRGQRDHRGRPRADRRQRPQRPAAVPRQLPDHAGLRAPPRALAPAPLRRADGAGRGRDRGRQHGARRLLRGPSRASRRRAGPAWT